MSASGPPAVAAPVLQPLSPPTPAASSSSPVHPFPPPQQDRDDEPEDADAMPPAAAVRLSVLRRFWLATNELQGVRRIRLAFFGVLGLAQVVAWIVILAGHYRDRCDQPLGPYLVMVVLRIAFAYPPYFWLTISPPRPNPRRDNDEARAALERDRHVGTLAIDHRVRRVSDLVSCYSLVLFILGNWWVIAARTCPATAPTLYKGAVVALVLSWLYVLEVLAWAILILFFLPFLLIGVRFFGVGQAKNEIGPLKKEDIASLPKRIFVGTLPEDAPATTAEPASAAIAPPPSESVPRAPTPAASTSPSRPPRRRQFWRLWRGRAKSSSRAVGAHTSGSMQLGDWAPFPAGVEPLRLPESQAACAICLCEYDPPPLRDAPAAADWQPELLGLLPCGHAFHTECLGDWLAVSGRCPLCQRDLHAPKKRRTARRGGTATGSSSTAGPSSSASGSVGGAGAEERV